MSGKELLECMSYVDERFVDEAEHQTIMKRAVSPWVKLLPVAACLCILIVGMISVWDYLPFHARSGDTAGSAESALDQEGVMGQIPQETSENEYSTNLPAGIGLGEVPSVILRVDSLTDSGFVGTVAELIDTDIIPVGTSLKVVITDDTQSELKKEDFNPAESASGTGMPIVGSLLRVQFVEYDADSGTIYVNMISPAEN